MIVSVAFRAGIPRFWLAKTPCRHTLFQSRRAPHLHSSELAPDGWFDRWRDRTHDGEDVFIRLLIPEANNAEAARYEPGGAPLVMLDGFRIQTRVGWPKLVAEFGRAFC